MQIVRELLLSGKRRGRVGRQEASLSLGMSSALPHGQHSGPTQCTLGVDTGNTCTKARRLAHFEFRWTSFIRSSVSFGMILGLSEWLTDGAFSPSAFSTEAPSTGSCAWDRH